MYGGFFGKRRISISAAMAALGALGSLLRSKLGFFSWCSTFGQLVLISKQLSDCEFFRLRYLPFSNYFTHYLLTRRVYVICSISPIGGWDITATQEVIERNGLLARLFLPFLCTYSTVGVLKAQKSVIQGHSLAGEASAGFSVDIFALQLEHFRPCARDT